MNKYSQVNDLTGGRLQYDFLPTALLHQLNIATNHIDCILTNDVDAQSVMLSLTFMRQKCYTELRKY